MALLFEDEFLDEAGGNNYHNKIVKLVSDPQKFNIILNKRKSIEEQIKHQAENYDADGSKGLKSMLDNAFGEFFKKASNQNELIDYVKNQLGFNGGKVEKTNKGADNTYLMRAFWESLDKGLLGKDNADYEAPKSGEISVNFLCSDPTVDPGSVSPTIISTLVGEPGKFDSKMFPKVSEISGYNFIGWQPDPNTFTFENTDGGLGKTNAGYQPVEETSDSDEVSSVSSDASMITVDFMVGNPEFPKEPVKLVKTLSANEGHFKDIKDQWPNEENTKELRGYEKYKFMDQWQPNPDELKQSGQVSAVFGIPGESSNGSVWFIVPHKRITFDNRTNDEDIYSDGTVDMKTSKAPYKATD